MLLITRLKLGVLIIYLLLPKIKNKNVNAFLFFGSYAPELKYLVCHDKQRSIYLLVAYHTIWENRKSYCAVLTSAFDE